MSHDVIPESTRHFARALARYLTSGNVHELSQIYEVEYVKHTEKVS
jgi:hypothetical protein